MSKLHTINISEFNMHHRLHWKTNHMKCTNEMHAICGTHSIGDFVYKRRSSKQFMEQKSNVLWNRIE